MARLTTRLLSIRALALASAALSLVAGLWAGLARIGWPLPVDARLVTAHGPLMAVGFFGTVVSLERAIANGGRWAFAAPIAAATAALGLAMGMPSATAALLMIAAGVVMVVIYAALIRAHPSLFLVVSATGALAFAVGAVVWLGGAPVFHVVPWWGAFLLLTVVGERLELTRLLPPSRRARHTLHVVLALYWAALGAGLAAPDVGARARGVAIAGAAAWLACFDVARRTIRIGGVARYAAACLLAGYAWLATAGVLGVVFGDVAVGPRYDALVHALFVGFAFSMIFGHAPMVLPAVLGVRVAFARSLYAPVVLLHAGLALRITGDLAGSGDARRVGGLVSAVAIVVFIAMMVRAARHRSDATAAKCSALPPSTKRCQIS